MTTYSFLDLETTGLDSNQEQIIEVSIINTDFKNPVIRSFQSLVRLEKGKQLPEFITKLTGITKAELKGAPPLTEVEDNIRGFIGDNVVVAQFAPFDLSFLGDVINPKEFYCTRTMSTLLFPGENPSLGPTCNRLGINLDGAHRAMADAKATMELFKLYKSHLNPKYPKGLTHFRNLVANTDKRPLTFIPKGARIIDLRGDELLCK